MNTNPTTIKELAATLGISEESAKKAILRDLKAKKARAEYNARPEVKKLRAEYNSSVEAKLRRAQYQEERNRLVAMGRKLESVLSRVGMSFEEALECLVNHKN